MDSDQPEKTFQIGYVEVAAGAVSGPGRLLVELAADYGFEPDAAPTPGWTQSGAPVEEPPADGWRVLHERERSVLIGTPATDDGLIWRVAHLELPEARGTAGTTEVAGTTAAAGTTGTTDTAGTTGTTGTAGTTSAASSTGARPTFRVHPDPLPLRPGRRERGRGLELRWPALLTEPGAASAAAGEFAIDIVNTGDTRWRPNGDGFLVVGVFTPPGSPAAAFGWASLGQGRAVPLDPGDYARVPVQIDRGAWKDLEPGPYYLRALLVDLDITTSTPLRVDLDAETIARHRPPSRRA